MLGTFFRVREGIFYTDHLCVLSWRENVFFCQLDSSPWTARCSGKSRHSFAFISTRRLAFPHMSTLSAQRLKGVESGNISAEVGTESWGQAGLDFPVLSLSRDRGDRDCFLFRGSFFSMWEGQTHHQLCPISSNIPHELYLHHRKQTAADMKAGAAVRDRRRQSK